MPATRARQARSRGVQARGQILTVRLTQADPTFLAEVAMPFFVAVKPSMPIDAKGINVYPSAGPYKIASREVGRQLVLERNTFYKGNRPANADRIVYTVNTELNQSLLQVRAGQADYDAAGLPPTAHDSLSREYGVKKGGNGRYFVNSVISTTYLSLNTIGGPLGKLSNRKAVNIAIDRPALLRVAGKFAGARTDQILPPNIRGFKQADIYPLKGANPTLAKRVSGGDSSNLTILHTTSATSIARAQVLQFNLTQAGYKVTLKPQPFAVAIKTAGTKSQAQAGDFDMFLIGWLADYPDPFDFINVLLDGDNIQEANNYELRLPEQPDVQQADEGRLRSCPATPRYSGIRSARHRPDAERRSVGAALERQHPRVHLQPHHELPLPPGLLRDDHQRGRDQVTRVRAGEAPSGDRGRLSRSYSGTTNRQRDHQPPSKRGPRAPVPDQTPPLGDCPLHRRHAGHVRHLLRHPGRSGATGSGPGRDAGGRGARR